MYIFLFWEGIIKVTKSIIFGGTPTLTGLKILIMAFILLKKMESRIPKKEISFDTINIGQPLFNGEGETI